MLVDETMKLHQLSSAELRKIERFVNEVEPMLANVREALVLALNSQIIANMGLVKCQKAAYNVGKDIPLDHPVFADYERVVLAFRESLFELIHTFQTQ